MGGKNGKASQGSFFKSVMRPLAHENKQVPVSGKKTIFIRLQWLNAKGLGFYSLRVRLQFL